MGSTAAGVEVVPTAGFAQGAGVGLCNLVVVEPVQRHCGLTGARSGLLVKPGADCRERALLRRKVRAAGSVCALYPWMVVCATVDL